MSAMPREKSWSKDGVTITYRTFNTPFTVTVSEVMSAALRFPTPTPEHPDHYSINKTVQIFYLAMPAIIKVECETGAALWGEILKEEVEKPSFLDDPVADYKRFIKTAPAEIFDMIDDGYLATREKTHLAPDPLRDDAPENPELDLEATAARNGEKDLANPTILGGGLSKKKSSPDSNSSSQAVRKAK
jgi:hypothetical protein